MTTRQTYSRNFTNVTATMDRDKLNSRFNQVLNSVSNMVANTSVYSTWIKLQIGSTEPLIFNTSSQSEQQNLLVELSLDKVGAGVANSFTIKFAYDPFKYGQDPTDEIEALDELIAKTMSYTIEDDYNGLKCFIQYGYSGYDGTDNSLVSPKYELYLTDIQSQVQTSTGMITYTLEGTSILSQDCSFVTTFAQITEEDKISPIQLVADILYKYYGDKDNAPSHLSDSSNYEENQYKYRIDIPDEYFSDMEDETVIWNTVESVSPWKYCQDILDYYYLTKTDKESGKYDDIDSITVDKRPRWYLFLTDVAGNKTIRLTHISPLLNKENDVVDTVYSLSKGFTWGIQAENSTNFWSNLVIGWNPKVNLRNYVIQKALWLRDKREIEKELSDATNEQSPTTVVMNGPVPTVTSVQSTTVVMNGPVPTVVQKDMKDELVVLYNQATDGLNQRLNENWEYYESTLTLVGIPADPVINTEVKVVPRILQSISRQAGIYIIQGMSDRISNNGTYTSELKLYRVDNLWGSTRTATLSNAGKAVANAIGGGGSTGGSGASASF